MDDLTATARILQHALHTLCLALNSPETSDQIASQFVGDWPTISHGRLPGWRFIKGSRLLHQGAFQPPPVGAQEAPALLLVAGPFAEKSDRSLLTLVLPHLGHCISGVARTEDTSFSNLSPHSEQRYS